MQGGGLPSKLAGRDCRNGRILSALAPNSMFTGRAYCRIVEMIPPIGKARAIFTTCVRVLRPCAGAARSGG